MRRAIRVQAHVLALAAVLLAATARAGLDEQAEAFRQKEEAERTRLGYWDDPDRFLARYPAPPLQFASVRTIAPGETITVVAEGSFAKGTFFGVSDDAELFATKPVKNGVELEIRAKADALPGRIEAVAIAPVTLEQASAAVARVAGRFAFELELDNGWTGKLRVAAKQPEPDVVFYDSEWTRPGEKAPFKRMPVAIAPGASGLEGELVMSEAEAEQAARDTETYFAKVKPDPEFDRQMGELTQRMERCMALAESAQPACMEGVQARSDALLKQQEQKMQAVGATTKSGRDRLSFGCRRLSIRRDATRLTGALTACADGDHAISQVRVKYLGK